MHFFGELYLASKNITPVNRGCGLVDYEKSQTTYVNVAIAVKVLRKSDHELTLH